MMDKILVPLDGSKASEAVLPHVRRIARRNHSEIILLRIPEVPPVLEYAALYSGALSMARDYIGRLQARLHADRFRVRSTCRGEVATDTILEVAREEQVSLIAMATHGRTGLSRMLFGSVAESVLRRTHIPMLLVRPTGVPVMNGATESSAYRYVLVPTDGSDASKAVMPAAAAAAKLMGATVRLLRVLEPVAAEYPHGWAVPMDSASPERYPDRESAEEDLREAADLFRKEGVYVEPVIGMGRAGDVIGDEANRADVDLLAMATHGRTGLANLVVGSVTRQVLLEANMPMLVVRAPKIVEARKDEELHVSP